MEPLLQIKGPIDYADIKKGAKIQISKYWAPNDAKFNTATKWTITITGVPVEGLVYDIFCTAKIWVIDQSQQSIPTSAFNKTLGATIGGSLKEFIEGVSVKWND